MSARHSLSRRFTLPFLTGLWLIACGNTAPMQGDFWRPWYDTPDASDPADLAVPAADLALPPVPIDMRTGTGDMRTGTGDMSSGVTDMSSGATDMTSTPGSCSLSVAVTTTSAGGRYSPRNIGAIWISDDSERFVKTLAIWADKRAKYLKRWNDATTAAMVPASRVDAISSATMNSHGLRSGTWNCTNASRAPVADGAYKVCFELTDYDGTGPSNCVPFTKGRAPVSLTPADSPSFTARKIEYKP